jgi:hypothetical protein
MRLPIIILGSVHNATLPVAGRIGVLTIRALPIVSVAILQMRLPITILGSVRNATLPVAGRIGVSTIQALLIVSVAILQMRLPTITPGSVPTATTPVAGQIGTLTTVDSQTAYLATCPTDLLNTILDSALSVMIPILGIIKEAIPGVVCSWYFSMILKCCVKPAIRQHYAIKAKHLQVNNNELTGSFLIGQHPTRGIDPGPGCA